MELWDAYDAKYEKIGGMTLVRGEEQNIPQGVYHLVCHVLVQHEDGTYLLMKRDPNKPYGGMWEATAGGSALKGETPPECAERELKEETGISADALSGKLLCIGKRISDETHSLYYYYICTAACDKNSVTLQEGETCDFRWASRREILDMPHEELLSRYMLRYIRDDEITIREERISAEEYISFLKRTDLGSQYPKERFNERINKLVDNVTISLAARNRDGLLVGALFGLTDYVYWLYVTDLGVDRDHERQGIGTALMKKAHEIAGGEKDIAVYLIANENAVPFYEKLGMKKADDVMQYNHIEWTEFTV